MMHYFVIPDLGETKPVAFDCSEITVAEAARRFATDTVATLVVSPTVYVTTRRQRHAVQQALRQLFYDKLIVSVYETFKDGLGFKNPAPFKIELSLNVKWANPREVAGDYVSNPR